MTHYAGTNTFISIKRTVALHMFHATFGDFFGSNIGSNTGSNTGNIIGPVGWAGGGGVILAIKIAPPTTIWTSDSAPRRYAPLTALDKRPSDVYGLTPLNYNQAGFRAGDRAAASPAAIGMKQANCIACRHCRFSYDII